MLTKYLKRKKKTIPNKSMKEKHNFSYIKILLLRNVIFAFVTYVKLQNEKKNE